MQVSCSIPTAGPLASRETIRRLGTLADHLGYDTIWISDHVVIPRRIESRYPYNADGAFGTAPDQPYYEPTAVIGFLAGATERARIGTSVLVLPYRNPLLLAKTVASLDDLSGGRVTLGVGVGWMQEEFQALGLPDDYFPRRGAVGDEWIQILKLIWTEENPSFEGQFHRFGNLGALPKPAQQPHPPILVGGNTRPALRRAVRHGTGWQGVNLPAPVAAGKIRELHAFCEEYGRDPSTLGISFKSTIRLVDDPAQGGAKEERSGLVIAGTPDQLVDQLGEYGRVGVEDLGIGFPRIGEVEETAGALERFAKEVMPKLR
ncbi:MAG TPA: LLM class F420-dependent oxidoreductase [Dehalococcoidia bacterium]|nr:LLM class F420-dependent oxidoreductase [Dehalococcoidia bacterium]